MVVTLEIFDILALDIVLNEVVMPLYCKLGFLFLIIFITDVENRRSLILLAIILNNPLLFLGTQKTRTFLT